MTGLSIVVPLHNEAQSLNELANELRQTSDRHGWTIEIIFVDDGSTDSSWEMVAALARADNRIRGLRLAQNYGKSAALLVGFQAANNSTIVMIDADLQDVPAEIPKLLERLTAGCDLVTGWKKDRQDSLGKRLTSSGYNWLVNLLSGMRLHDHNCGLKAMSRSVAQQLPLQRGMHRFITVFARQLGFRVSEFPVAHRVRKYGRSNYGWQRFPIGLFDLVRVGLAGRSIIKRKPNAGSFQVIERAN